MGASNESSLKELKDNAAGEEEQKSPFRIQLEGIESLSWLEQQIVNAFQGIQLEGIESLHKYNHFGYLLLKESSLKELKVHCSSVPHT